MARVDIGPSRVRRDRRRRRITIAASILGVLLVIFGGLVWLSRAPYLRITQVNINGAQTLSTSTIADFVRQEISGSYFHLFAKNNIFLYPKSQIEGGLAAALPTVASVEVHAADFHTLTVAITERQPAALWCPFVASSTEAMQGGGDSGCLLLDQNGIAYAPAASTSVDSFDTYYGALQGSSTPPQFLMKGQFQPLAALVGALAQNQQGNAITGVTVDENNDVHVAFADGFTLLFALADGGGDVYQNFVLALGSAPFMSHPLSDFEYLDLRFGDKLYYKLKTQ